MIEVRVGLTSFKPKEWKAKAGMFLQGRLHKTTAEGKVCQAKDTRCFLQHRRCFRDEKGRKGQTGHDVG